MKLKLSNKLLIPLVGLVVAGICISSLITYMSSKNALEAVIVGQIKQIAGASADNISGWLQRNITDVDSWTKQDVVKKSLSAAEEGQEARRAASRRMKEYIDDYKIFQGLRLADADGLVVASSSAGSIGNLNVAGRAYFKASMDGKQYISDVLKSKTTGNPILVVSAPVKEAGKIRGVVYGVVDLTSFTAKFFSSIKVGRSGYAYIVNSRGILLSHPDPSLIMKLDISDFDFGREILAKKEGVIRYEYDGVRKIVAFEEDRLTGWIIAVTAPEEEVFSPALDMRNVILIIGVVMVFFLFIGIKFMTRVFVVNPLKFVMDGLEDIAEGEGDLTNRLDPRSDDETVDLAGWFNMFMGRMHRTISDIVGEAETLDTSSVGMKKISRMMAQISTAASEQPRTTKEIADNVARASRGISEVNTSIANSSVTAREISRDISEVNKFAGDVSHGSSQVSMGTGELADISGRLKDLVKKFKV